MEFAYNPPLNNNHGNKPTSLTVWGANAQKKHNLVQVRSEYYKCNIALRICLDKWNIL